MSCSHVRLAVPLALLVLVLVSACSSPAVMKGSGAGDASAPAAPGSLTADQVLAEAANIEQMTSDERRQALGALFPVEVPVPKGTFVRANPQGQDVWDYRLIVAAHPQAVAQWYASTFTGRSWTLASTGELDGGGYYLILRKNAAEARYDVRPGEHDGTSEVTAVVGVGAGVLEVQ